MISSPPNRSEARLLAFIRDHTATHGYAPTVRTMAALMALKSPSTIIRMLDQLQAKGLITRDKHRANSVQIVEQQPTLDQASVEELMEALEAKTTALPNRETVIVVIPAEPGMETVIENGRDMTGAPIRKFINRVVPSGRDGPQPKNSWVDDFGNTVVRMVDRELVYAKPQI